MGIAGAYQQGPDPRRVHCPGVRSNICTKPARSLVAYSMSEVPRVLFLGICLDFYYSLLRVLLPKFGFHFDRGSISQALVERARPPESGHIGG